MPKKTAEPKKVESIKHKDKRTNIPTEELRDFVADEELAPKTMLYPRDPSLDPQLVWKGKTSRIGKTSPCLSCPSTFRRRFTRKRLSTHCRASRTRE